METLFIKSKSVSFKKDKIHLLFATTALLYASYKIIQAATKKNKLKLAKEIPVPGFPYFFVGHMFSLGELPGRTLEAWHNKFGPLIKLYMGSQTWIMVGDPLIAHKIFVTNDTKTSYRPVSYLSHIYSKGGNGIAFGQPNTTNWKSTRAKLHSVLQSSQIDIYMDDINLGAQELADQLIKESEKGGIEPFQYLKFYAMNNTFLLSFDEKFENIDDPDFKAFSDIVERTTKELEPENDLANFFPIFSFFDYFSSKKKESKEFFENVRDPAMRRNINIALNSKKSNILNSIKKSGADWTEDQYIAFVADIISTGTDPVATTLMWNFNLMCHYPDCQQTASIEIDQFIRLNGRLPNFSERTQLPYTISIIKECLRFRPIMPFGLPHVANEEIEIDGYIIPKGSNILLSMYKIHHGSFYENPELFDPERHMNNLKTMRALQNGKTEERDQFNFGWGRRGCPGAYVAEVQLFLAFVHTLGRCRIIPPAEGMPDINGVFNSGLNILPLPCKFGFIKRSDSLI